MTGIEIERLRSPILVGAFEGWNDAGDAASAAIDHLASVWPATPYAAIDPEDYYDFQVNRPMVTLVNGETRRIQWPTSRLSICRLPEARHDVVLLRGIEPNMRWQAFCAEILDLVTELGVELVVTLGALLADSPHTRPVSVTGTASDRAIATRLGLTRSQYEGPTGIVGVLHDACLQRGLPSVSFWAAVPYYVPDPPAPKVTLALLHRVEDALDIVVPLGGLEADAREWEHKVDAVAQENTDIADYVRRLEERDAVADLPEASGEQIAREFERFLRRGDEPGKG